MHLYQKIVAGVAFGAGATSAAAVPATGASGSPLVSTNGQWAAIPTWDLQSSASAPSDLATLSKPGADTSKWHHINASRCTVVGCLLHDGTYKEADIWFSNNLDKIDRKQFQVPWLYRNEFALNAANGTHFLLQTNGITSKADLYFNGKQIASKSTQTGAYGGQVYDISSYVGQNNALVVQAYPTVYHDDFGQSFVDWNPYPPDNGTGVWRNIDIKQTGTVALGPLRVTTDFKAGASSSTVTLKSLAQNLGSSDVTFTVSGAVARDSGAQAHNLTGAGAVTLKAGQAMDVTLTAVIDSPAVWWPKQWGDQPLYKAQLSVSADGAVSDAASKTFGFRTVTSSVANTDITFSVNGKPFQVLGGGYGPDMFLRWDADVFTSIAKYTLDMGLNTIRLEGKMEHPEMYEIADRLGLMVLPGWECCDKWEAWSYNNDLPKPLPVWTAGDYATANASMRHEGFMLQAHPSVLGFLVGSDYWPDDKATDIYLTALKEAGWQTPIVASAAKAGYPKSLGPGGMKMDGPYDWVPPNYWYDTEPADDRLGAAFGFGSEQSPGGGTPDLSSLKKFLSSADMDDLWRAPNKGLFHQSTTESSFHNRTIFNAALWQRLGAPSSVEDYVQKTQILDYEATRAEFEGFAAMWNAKRPATGVIYWMLNAAWPSLHWAIFDYYLHPAGAYYGTKVGGRVEHVVYDYVHKSVWLINRSLDRSGARTVKIEAVGGDGKTIVNTTASASTAPNTSKSVATVSGLSVKDVAFLRLTLLDDKGASLSRNVYWLASSIDTLNWGGSNWYYTPVSKYANFQALNKLQTATVSATTGNGTVVLENKSSVPAFFISLNLVDKDGADIVPVSWSDNYVTLFPNEKLELQYGQYGGSKGATVLITGKNIAKATLSLA